NSMDILDQCDVVHGHIFPYSPKKGTPAANMPQVGGNIIKKRARSLRAKVKKRAEKWRDSLIGSKQNILTEKSGLSGYSENFAQVKLDKVAAEGRVVEVEIIDQVNGELIGKVPS
ncbi:hypothetical protein MNBD_ALPHA04-1441, partial [hydrothermal vent metagenome]